MASETAKQDLIQTTFRRASLTDHGVEKIQTERIPGILGQMGQIYDQVKLKEWIQKLDPTGSGYLDHENYNKLCKEFVKDPAAIAKFEGDEFAFKHLIRKSDFASP